jgi:hypothetical protein
MSEAEDAAVLAAFIAEGITRHAVVAWVEGIDNF